MLFNLWTMSEPVFVDKSAQFLFGVGVRFWIALINSHLHPENEFLPECLLIPLLAVMEYIFPLVNALHGVENGGLNDFLLLFRLQKEQVEQFLNENWLLPFVAFQEQRKLPIELVHFNYCLLVFLNIRAVNHILQKLPYWPGKAPKNLWKCFSVPFVFKYNHGWTVSFKWPSTSPLDFDAFLQPAIDIREATSFGGFISLQEHFGCHFDIIIICPSSLLRNHSEKLGLKRFAIGLF